MNYVGKLYGKIAGVYFDTGATSADWDKMQQENKAMAEKLRFIPVSEDLPPRHKTVLAKDSGGYYFTAHISTHGWVNIEKGEYVNDTRKITHWRRIL